MQRAVLNERNIVAKMNHPYLTQLLAAFQNGVCLFMAFDLYTGGSLRSLMDGGQYSPSMVNVPRVQHGLRGFNDETVIFYGSELLLGIEHMHKLGVIHRDLKAENVMIDGRGHLKIIDFGFAVQFQVLVTLDHACKSPGPYTLQRTGGET